ncbi:glycosyltransferase family 2 protein [Actibacterium sp. XHP0104]|uniref:glycosyltransferase family 2 protein n=1 Tax=Actibacterium sp. XHP0104 TaxID=2984335 RepID=UPI0021E97694|nr:glycosyltransferase family 2 protein [Actibacterium sp. XHP0104]MCV2882045.1 glycosyltransferase family 2 protein [Actibacterium sp. XHP0104]
MGLWQRYKLRLARRRLRIRALRKRRELSAVAGRTGQIKPNDILLFCTLRNEKRRLPYFLQYYRQQGVQHFLFVDNGSDDGSREFLEAQPDVSLWSTTASYKRSRFGVDWMNWLLRKYGQDHWCVVVDVDEFLVYPFCDTRPIAALTDWLDSSGVRSFGTMMLDMYPRGPVQAETYVEGQNPFDIAAWFDSGNYIISRNPEYRNLWIQGGPRARLFFPDRPQEAPALNKIPLIKWHRSYTFVNSTHMLLPRGLNLVYDDRGGEKASGVLLHAKFLDTFIDKSEEEIERKEHYGESREYKAYVRQMQNSPVLWNKWSEKYINWRQLEILGLMSKGNWA